jgi:hypothetical protein
LACGTHVNQHAFQQRLDDIAVQPVRVLLAMAGVYAEARANGYVQAFWLGLALLAADLSDRFRVHR